MGKQKKQTDFVAISITTDLKQGLIQMCEEDEVSMSQFIRKLIRREFVARQQASTAGRATGQPTL